MWLCLRFLLWKPDSCGQRPGPPALPQGPVSAIIALAWQGGGGHAGRRFHHSRGGGARGGPWEASPAGHCTVKQEEPGGL